MNWRGILGIVFVCAGAALTIISMATLQWAVAITPQDKSTYGLVQLSSCDVNNPTVCTTMNLGDYCNQIYGNGNAPQWCLNYKKGGQQVIACGVCSLVMFAVGFLCMYFAYKWSAQKWRVLCTISWLVSGGLTILAVFLYSKLSVNLDYAFILYLFAAFTSLIGSTVVLLGPGVGQTHTAHAGG